MRDCAFHEKHKFSLAHATSIAIILLVDIVICVTRRGIYFTYFKRITELFYNVYKYISKAHMVRNKN